jgi:hypothetical protein
LFICEDTVITLNGDGNYLFIIEGLLAVGENTRFKLEGGANAENILLVLTGGFVGSSILGDNSTWEGSILAKSRIRFGKGATLHGCALTTEDVSSGF